MNKYRWVFLISILANIVFILYFLIFNSSFKTNPSSNNNYQEKQKYWLNRNEIFEVLPKIKNTKVFLGNSLTQNFEWSEYFRDSLIINRGIFADSLNGLLKRLDQIVSLQPQKVFLEIGINDIASGHNAHEVYLNYLKLLKSFKENSPKTKIYVQSVFPTAISNTILKNYCNSKVNSEVVELNNLLLSSSKKNGYVFIDLHSKFFF